MAERDPDTKSGPAPTPDLRPRWQADIDADRSTRLADLDPAALDVPPPSPEAWRKFIENLEHAQRVARAPDPGAELYAAQLACKGVVDLLKSTGERETHALQEPYWTLLAALKDVAEGAARPKLFTTPTKPEDAPKKGGRPVTSAARLDLQTLAAVAIHELHKAGVPLVKASRRVGRQIERHGVKAKDLGAVARDWRERAMEDPKRWAHSVYVCRQGYRRVEGRDGTPAERAELLLHMLQTGKF